MKLWFPIALMIPVGTWRVIKFWMKEDPDLSLCQKIIYLCAVINCFLYLVLGFNMICYVYGGNGEIIIVRNGWMCIRKR